MVYVNEDMFPDDFHEEFLEPKHNSNVKATSNQCHSGFWVKYMRVYGNVGNAALRLTAIFYHISA